MDANETIQTDVLAAEEAAAAASAPEQSTEANDDIGTGFTTDPVQRREDKMAALAKKRREEQERDRKAAALMNDPDLSGEEYDDRAAALRQPESPPEKAPGGQEGVDPTAGDEKPAVATAEATQATKNGWRTREDGQRVKTLMVNGEARELTEDEYDRRLQKDMAGDQKLRLAAETERKLADRQRQLDERERQLATRQMQPPEKGADELKVLASKYNDALLDGDTDAATAAMIELMTAGRGSSTPNIDVIVSQAATQAASKVKADEAQERYNKSINDGWEKFQEEYTDVLGDADAMAFADIQVKKLRSDGTGRTPKDIILEAGRITREKLGLKGAVVETPPPPTASTELRDERLERKANIRPMPKIGSTRHQEKSAAPVDMSPQAKIERMRSARFRA